MTKPDDLKNICLAPIAKGPFFGSKYVPGTCGTNGGLRIHANAQVINVKGQPIPRLYAVGNTSGSVMGDAYAGGGSCLGSGGVFGMLAGRHAAGLKFHLNLFTLAGTENRNFRSLHFKLEKVKGL